MEPEDQRVASTKRPVAATSVAVNQQQRIWCI
jgi:hypothetical protein